MGTDREVLNQVSKGDVETDSQTALIRTLIASQEDKQPLSVSVSAQYLCFVQLRQVSWYSPPKCPKDSFYVVPTPT